MNVADGATFATQFGGATAERSTGDFAGDFGAVVGATQAELPPVARLEWFRSRRRLRTARTAVGTPKTHYST